MPRIPHSHSDRVLLNRIRRAPGNRAGYKQLVRELGLGGGRERRLLVEQLTRMVARGDLVRLADGAWAAPLPASEVTSSADRDERTLPLPHRRGMMATVRSSRDRLLSGRLDLHRDGFGFVRPETVTGRDADIFIPPTEINGAMHGDLVLIDEMPPGRDGRRSGRVARVLTRRNPTVVGVFHAARPHGRRDPGGFLGNHVTPLDERLSGIIYIVAGDEIVPAVADTPHRMLGDEARHTQLGWRPADPATTLDAAALDGLAVDVEITAFPTPGRPARGRVIEVLGPPDAFGVDVEIVIRKHHIPHTFPAAVLAEAADRALETVATLPPDELALREDLRALPIVTIDGETARDFDDAVLVRPLPNGDTELHVHIADVGHYVLPGSALDTEARVRGNSVYFPDRAVPMLPHALSSGMCSLLPDEDRLVLSCIMQVDPQGEIVAYRVCEGVIRSARRCTYTAVQHCLNAGKQEVGSSEQEGASSEQGSRHASASYLLFPVSCSEEDLAERARIGQTHPGLPAAFDAMLELALRLNAKRVRRGSIDFDLPEPIVQFDPDGNMQAILRSERGWAHRLIEEFMLSANECVAHWLERQGVPSIYRIHEMPDPKRIVDFEETAATFGHSLGLGNLPVRKLTMKTDRRDARQRSQRGRDSRAPQQHEIPASIPVTPQLYQKLVRRISGTPEERILAYLMLRSLKQARYAEKNEGHFALASPSYTHFTSPIRRYPDLIVHRLVREMLRRGADPHGGPILSTDSQPWQAEFDRQRGQHAAKASGPGVQGMERRPSATYPLHPVASPEPISPKELQDIAAECSQTERRAADAERELIEWKKITFMQDRIGEDFHAVILSCTKYGFFVELDDLFIEGLVPLASLVGDFYSFRDTDRTIVGARTGHVFSLGGRVEVILDRIDRQQRRLQFALLPGTEPVANTGAPRKSKTPTKFKAPKKSKTKAESKSAKRKGR